MNSPDLQGVSVGVNGSDVYNSVGFGDKIIGFYTMLNRNMQAEKIEQHMKLLLNSPNNILIDLLVLIFQTRDIRGGKGERDLFYNMIILFVNHFPKHAFEVLKLVPEYGYWKDLWRIYYKVSESVRSDIDRIAVEQFEKDMNSEKPSLLAKWLPREKSKNNQLAHHFAHLFFSNVPKENNLQIRAYRKAVSEINRKIDTTEIKMCGKTWTNIVPKVVPGRLMKRNKLAFLNEMKKKGTSELRYPDNLDRNTCRFNFIKYISDLSQGKEVAKGADVIMPHELVSEVLLKQKQKSTKSEELLQAQWEAIRNATKKGGIQKCVFMCDFSGSMDGTPKLVSLALGILGSEIAETTFADHILTFDHEPKWYSFKGCKTLREKVESIGSIGQGLNTDFQKACDLILKKLVTNNIPPSEAPTNMIVLTDMGFDRASKEYGYDEKNLEWETHFSMIHAAFEKYGYAMPRIVCWNLRAEFEEFHSEHDTKGVVNLSGWSPSAFKILQTDGIDALTPKEMVRKILDSSRYDPVRELARTIFTTA